MFSQFFGNYLLENQKISTEQYSSCMNYISANHVKLGRLAEIEGLLARKQANELNYLQMENDRQIGDLAVERGYLTKSEVNYLLKCQGNPYLIFIQALEENHFMERDDIDACIAAYQEENGFSDQIMDAIKNGQIEHLLPAFADVEDERLQTLLGLILRNIIRFVNSYLRIDKGEFATSLPTKYIASQKMTGDYEVLIGFSSDDDGILMIADGYAKEVFDEVNEDAMDSVAEFVNCVCGLYAAELSYHNVSLDMLPPVYEFDSSISDSDSFFVLPLFIQNKKINLIVQIK